MGTIKETSSWDSTIYQIEATDPVLGGEYGPVNQPIKGLANRTVYLKGQTDAINSEIKDARGTYANLNGRITALQQSRLRGTFDFDPNTGATVVHNIGNTNYVVNVDALTPANGTLGEVYVEIGKNSFTVRNTGSFAGKGCYTIVA